MPRVAASSTAFAVSVEAAVLATLKAMSSRMRFDSSVVLPVMNCARPDGCVVDSSMRVRTESSKCSSGVGPPTTPSSSRHRSHEGAAMFTGTKWWSPTVTACGEVTGEVGDV